MAPLHNHVLMEIPALDNDLQSLHREILSFLWKKTVDAETTK